MNTRNRSDFGFDISEVANLLSLKIRRRNARGADADCPFCSREGKMNLNTDKNVFRCNYCGEAGGMIALYAKAMNTDNSSAYREICESLRIPLSAPEPRRQDAARAEETQRASPDVCDQVYRLLFSMLTLSGTHRDALMKRGLSKADIEKYGFRSTPAFGNFRLTEKLEKLGCHLDGVPGFYRKDGAWLPRFSSNSPGIIIPVLSMDGKVRGAQIRLDQPRGDAKYIWFSSSGMEGGTGSGSPVHFAGDPEAKTVYITEGPLKATVAHALSGKTFAAVAGVNQTGGLPEIFERLRQNGTETVVEAYDMDKETNHNVANGCRKMIGLAAEYGFVTERLSWDPAYKGIDDFLAAKNERKE